MKGLEDLYYSRNPKRPFPRYRAVIDEEAHNMWDTLYASFGLKDPSEGFLDMITVSKIGKLIEVIDESDFQLSEQLQLVNLTIPDSVLCFYLNSGDISEFNLSDVDSFFDDLYYPSSIDLMISDKAFSWMFYIDHDLSLYQYTRL